jgi:hypothetical protein
MTAIVPDTLQGALIVSVIDFLLSFLIISGIGFVLSLFPLLNRLAVPFRAPRPLPVPVESKAAKAEEAVPDDIAAISAAIVVVMDGAPHRIINIQPSARRSSWVAEGRIAQHGSHQPRA